ncbi:MAG TPA: Flp pilus assembly protein CpaB [Actinomycetales bacterium]|nr:Flp pilus assembly protein CpaB [Actinomycetales bacterium]
MNPRQRRGAVLMILAALGAVAVFAAVYSYVEQIGRQVGPMTTVYRFTDDVKPFSDVTSAVLERVEVPKKWVPAAAVTDFDETQGLVTKDAVVKGSVLQRGMLQPPPELKPGERELAILIDAETGVAGKVRAGDLVDIYATFGDSQRGQESRILVQNARVLDIGQLQRAEPDADKSLDFAPKQVVPVTFALSVKDSLSLAYAESFADKVRLARVAPGTRSDVPAADSVLRDDDVLPPTKKGGGK